MWERKRGKSGTRSTQRYSSVPTGLSCLRLAGIQSYTEEKALWPKGKKKACWSASKRSFHAFRFQMQKTKGWKRTVSQLSSPPATAHLSQRYLNCTRKGQSYYCLTDSAARRPFNLFWLGWLAKGVKGKDQGPKSCLSHGGTKSEATIDAYNLDFSKELRRQIKLFIHAE